MPIKKGFKHSMESRKKMSDIAKETWKTRPRKLSEEHKKKISEGLKGRVFSEESRKKLSNAHKGRKFTAKSIKRMSEAAQKRFQDPEQRKKISEAQRKRFQDPKEREKLSKAVRLPTKELMKRVPPNIESRLRNGKVEVRCKTCEQFFAPEPWKIRAARKKFENGYGIYLYCSTACKNACPVFDFRTGVSIDPRSKLYKPISARAHARRCQTNHLKQLQCDEAGHNYCEKCRDIIDVELHHTLPVSRYATEAITSSSHILLCKRCHRQLHNDCK